VGYITARRKFEEAKANAKDNKAAIETIAEGLVQFTRAVENDLRKLQSTIDTVKGRQ
jgi:hypothetical protein